MQHETDGCLLKVQLWSSVIYCYVSGLALAVKATEFRSYFRPTTSIVMKRDEQFVTDSESQQPIKDLVTVDVWLAGVVTGQHNRH